ncbi:cytochrome P450 [Pholiota conissans]|uniref:Cytochrome P450 n=1 Tax=Pholiota conissans TaxID=109636 RepID=A0A9P6D0D5_9AGAR|nr:cytochrome P450 [Pholiota conissans]
MAFLDDIPLPYYTVPVAGISLVLLYSTFQQWRSPLRKLPYPPGPPEKSFIAGNTSDMPTERTWLAFAEWGRKYGSISHFRIFDQHTIILNSLEDNIELLEKRSNNYSDRPNLPMIDLMGWTGFDVGFMRYGARWRYHRRLFQQFFKPEAALDFLPTQTRKVNDMLYGLLTTPDDFMNHYRTLPAAIIMAITYDHDVAPKDDYFVNLAEAAVARLSQMFFPGASLLNAFPILRFTPSWFPGAMFKRFALESRKLTYQMLEVPIADVEARMKTEKPPHCITSELLQNCKSKQEYDDIAGVVATAYAAGADTTASSLGTFFMAMALNPEIQARAKKDLDLVVGSDRLVNIDDRPSMPYLEAIYREVVRWRPVVPLGVAHAAMEDDVYKGYYIPKGATVISNIWAVNHDPVKYPNPEKFNPDRYFNENGELNDDEVVTSFGFGRRICPGRHLASASAWLAIATVLQNFDISKKRDALGNEIPISGEYCDGLITHPLPFECSITPRSEASKQLILNAERTKH